MAGRHAGRRGVNFRLLADPMSICVGPLAMHVEGAFHAGEVHGVGTVDGPGEVAHPDR